MEIRIKNQLNGVDDYFEENPIPHTLTEGEPA